MKFESFEALRYLETHMKNKDDFAHKLHSMTQEETFKLMSSLKNEEMADKKMSEKAKEPAASNGLSNLQRSELRST